MPTPLFESPGIYQFQGAYFSQKSPEEWVRLRSIAAQSGGFLSEISIDGEEPVEPFCPEWQDAVTQIKDYVLKEIVCRP